jgi:hypothetical protein
MHRSRAPCRSSVARWRCPFWADCTTNISEHEFPTGKKRRKAARDSPVIERMKELSAQYPRDGYRRIRIFLGRDSYRMSGDGDPRPTDITAVAVAESIC